MAKGTKTVDATYRSKSRSGFLLKRIELSGAVISGGGDGKKFMELPWVKQQVTEKLGFTPYPGTLNVKLNEKNAERRKLVEKNPSAEICPAEGYYKGLLFKAFIGIVECAIVLPEVPRYPKSLLEVIAPVNLRKTLQLEDGFEVTVAVNV
jgi:riboflavin kinase